MKVLCQAGCCVLVALMLTACSWWPIGLGVPGPLARDAGYSGTDSAELQVQLTQVGCCYIEGSLHFVQLAGPTPLTWQIGQLDPKRVGTDSLEWDERPLTLKGGTYTITFWERVCDGSCENLDPESPRCSTNFDAAPGNRIVVRATFPLGKACSARVAVQ